MGPYKLILRLAGTVWLKEIVCGKGQYTSVIDTYCDNMRSQVCKSCLLRLQIIKNLIFKSCLLRYPTITEMVFWQLTICILLFRSSLLQNMKIYVYRCSGAAYFIYTFVFNLRFFPFMNILGVIIAIGRCLFVVLSYLVRKGMVSQEQFICMVQLNIFLCRRT